MDETSNEISFVDEDGGAVGEGRVDDPVGWHGAQSFWLVVRKALMLRLQHEPIPFPIIQSSIGICLHV